MRIYIYMGCQWSNGVSMCVLMRVYGESILRVGNVRDKLLTFFSNSTQFQISYMSFHSKSMHLNSSFSAHFYWWGLQFHRIHFKTHFRFCDFHFSSAADSFRHFVHGSCYRNNNSMVLKNVRTKLILWRLRRTYRVFLFRALTTGNDFALLHFFYW